MVSTRPPVGACTDHGDTTLSLTAPQSTVRRWARVGECVGVAVGTRGCGVGGGVGDGDGTGDGASVGAADSSMNWDDSLSAATRLRAYRVTVSEAATGKSVWDSGTVTSNATSQIEYEGTSLTADTDYTWTAQWLAQGPSPSAVASSTFSTALLGAADWRGAEWVGSEDQRVLRATLTVPAGSDGEGKSVARARAYIAAPGCYALYVNGKPAGDEMGVCPWTQFDQTVLSDALDIAALLRPGDNALELVLGRGMWVSKSYAKDPAALALFTARLADGTALALRTAGAPAPPAPTPAPTPEAARVGCALVHEHSGANLGCGAGLVVRDVTAFFGTPTGKCSEPAAQRLDPTNTFARDAKCDAAGTRAALLAACQGRQHCAVSPHCAGGVCTLAVGAATVADPCHMTPKQLAVAVQCGAPTPAPAPTPAVPTPAPGPAPAPGAGKWSGTAGPILADDPFVGCETDVAAAAAPGAWTWAPATVAPHPPHGTVRALAMPPSRRLRTLAPVAARVVGSGHLRFDFAENFVGAAEINVTALLPLFGLDAAPAAAGNVTIVAKHGEITDGLNSTVPSTGSGNVSFPWAEQKQTDQYKSVSLAEARAGTLPLLRPRFVWHGFQYVEISVSGAAADAAKAAGAAASGAVAGVNTGTALEATGSVDFTGAGAGGAGGAGGSRHMLDDIQQLVTNSQRANVAAGIPTDCPTREKHGWLGDAQVTAEEAMLNFHMAPVYTLFLETIRDSQQANASKRAGDVAGVVPVNHLGVAAAAGGTAGMVGAGPDGITDISWSAAYPLIARWMLRHYGDARVVRDHFDNIAAFLDDLTAHAAASSKGGLADFFTWGDWCAVESRALATPGTGPALAAFNYLLGLDAAAEMAAAIGREADASRYGALAARLRPVFRERFYNSTRGAYGSEKGFRELELQSMTAAPLALGGVVRPGAEQAKVLAALKADIDETNAGHFTVGSVGAKHLLPQLSAHGLHEQAMRIATRNDYPSFGYWLANGATTCWESYHGYADPSHPPPPTRNHIFLCGGVGEWMYRAVAGVGPAADGYARVAVAPRVTAGGESDGGPAAARATLKSARGEVGVSWVRAPAAGILIALNATVPPAVEGAAVTVPALGAAAAAKGAGSLVVYEGGNKIWAGGAFSTASAGISAAAIDAATGGVTFECAPGRYRFTTAKQ
eukprot:g3514.t1